MSDEISRRQFLRSAAVVSALGGLGAAAASGADRSRRDKNQLNILMIVCDQERAWKTLPAGLELPGRNEIAARGVIFKNYQVNAIACGPARGVFYTGQHVMSTGMYDNGGPPPRPTIDPARTPTLGKLLKDHGYYTAYKGKWHLSYVNRPNLLDHTQELKSFGFDEWQKAPDDFGRPGAGAIRDAVVAAEAVDWLKHRGPAIAKQRPWFLAVNLINPHDIMFFDATGQQNESVLPNPGAGHGPNASMLTAPKRAPYDKDLGFDLPPSFPDTLGSKPRAHAAYNEFCNMEFGTIAITDVEAWRRYQNYYFNCLRDVDTEIARIFTALNESGQASRTIVVFTADHGEMGGAHGMRAKGPLLYAENADVPLVIAHPDIAGGKTCDGVVGSIDVVPTLLSLAGVGAQALASDYPFLKGYDISSLLASPQSKSKRNDAGNLLVFSAALGTNPLAAWHRSKKPGDARFPFDFIDMENRNFLRGLYDGRYRFGRYFSPDNHHMPTDWQTLLANNDLELYDDIKDPHNLDNLANQPALHRQLILELNAKLNALIAREAGVDDGSHMPGQPSLWRRT